MSEPTDAPVPPPPPVPPAPPVPPVPQYGEYAPAGYVAPQPVAGPGAQAPGAAASPQRERKTWDLVLTTILLVMGFFGAGIGVIYGLLFTDPTLLAEAFEQQGYPGFDGDAGAAPAILIVSHALLYLIALGAIPLLIGRRVAFWLPLAAGIVAAIIFWSTVTGVLLSDPGFIDQLS